MQGGARWSACVLFLGADSFIHFTVKLFQTVLVRGSKCQWFSGKIQRCHRWAPSSILGWRKNLLVMRTLDVSLGEKSFDQFIIGGKLSRIRVRKSSPAGFWHPAGCRAGFFSTIKFGKLPCPSGTNSCAARVPNSVQMAAGQYSIKHYRHFCTTRLDSSWGTVGGAAQSFSLFTLET